MVPLVLIIDIVLYLVHFVGINCCFHDLSVLQLLSAMPLIIDIGCSFCIIVNGTIGVPHHHPSFGYGILERWVILLTAVFIVVCMTLSHSCYCSDMHTLCAFGLHRHHSNNWLLCHSLALAHR